MVLAWLKRLGPTVQAAMAELEALERAAAAQETLTAWQGFLARTEAHEAVRAA